jgi:hypothetical protein
MSEPIACTLTSEAVAAGRAGLLPGLADRALTKEATEDGYRLSFAASSETLHSIAAVIDAERQCCRWLSFVLTVPSGEGAITLTLSGPTGAKDFLDGLFAQGS